MIDCIIVGSGLAGVVMAERIAAQLNENLIVENDKSQYLIKYDILNLIGASSIFGNLGKLK